MPVEDIGAQAAFTCEIIVYYETVEPNCGRRRRKDIFDKILINRPWRVDSPVFSFYILSVKGVVKELWRPTVSDVFMRGNMMWRSKLLLALIIYFAGFATAVYYLAPADAKMNAGGIKTGGFGFGSRTSQFESEEFGKVAGASMRKFVTFAGEKAVQLGEIVKRELAEQKKK